MLLRQSRLLLGLAWSSCYASVSEVRKVVCLHGYAQNGAIVRDRSGGFRKPFKKAAYSVEYPDGPFGCTANGEDEVQADADLQRRAWWRGHSGQTTYGGWPETRSSLLSLCEEERFDGVMGFSQGAAAAAMLCAELADRPELRPKFAVFISGFVPRDETAGAALLAGVSNVPSLHIIGVKDELVVAERSRALATLFADAVVIEHPGGHMIPSGAAVRSQVIAFLDEVRGLSTSRSLT